MAERKIKPVRCDQCIAGQKKHNISWMWISHDLKVIWLENPKVASTSVKMAIGVQPKGAVKGDLSNPYNFKRLGLPRDKIFQFDDYFIFGFCRNPWDRMVSAWRNFTTGQSRLALLRRHWGIDKPEKLSFIQFVKLVNKHWPMINHHWAQQIAFVPVDKVAVNFVGRFETIDDSWNRIMDATGISRNLGHFYGTKHGHYSHYYDDTTIELVRQLYAEDIDAFGYTYESEGTDGQI